MTVDLKPEQQQIVERAIAAGIVGTADDVIELGLQAVRERLLSQPNVSSSDSLSKEAWKRRFHEFIESQPTGLPLLSDEDISRDSIYGDRGL